MRSLELIFALSSYRQSEDLAVILSAVSNVPSADLDVALEVALLAGELDNHHARALLDALRTLGEGTRAPDALVKTDLKFEQLEAELRQVESRRAELAARVPAAAPVRARLLALVNRHDELQRSLDAARTELEAIRQALLRTEQIREEISG